MQYKCDSQFAKVPENASITGAQWNRLMVQLSKEHTNLERTHSGSQVTLVTGGVSSPSGSLITVGGHNAKEVTLTEGVHTISFGATFTVPFIWGILSCIGTIDGQSRSVGYRVITVTNTDMTVEVDADCTLQHFEIATT